MVGHVKRGDHKGRKCARRQEGNRFKERGEGRRTGVWSLEYHAKLNNDGNCPPVCLSVFL